MLSHEFMLKFKKAHPRMPLPWHRPVRRGKCLLEDMLNGKKRAKALVEQCTLFAKSFIHPRVEMREREQSGSNCSATTRCSRRLRSSCAGHIELFSTFDRLTCAEEVRVAISCLTC